MAPILDWKKLMRVDPDALPRQEELADRLLETLSKVLKGKVERISFAMHSSLTCFCSFTYINYLFREFQWYLYKKHYYFFRLMGKTWKMKLLNNWYIYLKLLSHWWRFVLILTFSNFLDTLTYLFIYLFISKHDYSFFSLLFLVYWTCWLLLRSFHHRGVKWIGQALLCG